MAVPFKYIDDGRYYGMAKDSTVTWNLGFGYIEVCFACVLR